MNHKKEIVKLLKSFTPKYRVHRVFMDFVELGAIAFSNQVDLKQFSEREERYMKTISKYSKEEADIFAKMLRLLIDGLDKNHMTDLLGEAYMELEISNKNQGQFFTPIEVSKLMAELTIEGRLDEIERNGYISMNEPAVGGGAGVIAFACALQKRGVDYSKKLRVVCQEIDIDLVHMCYLQLSILGIDAVVMRGDTLMNEFDSYWYTPAYVQRSLNEWEELDRLSSSGG